jgi:hypothetical protein
VSADAIAVEIKWAINPFRGDRFEQAWRPVAEAALDYGATAWALLRSTDGTLEFTQYALFPDKDDFDRYWYSEEVADVRVAIAGYYQVPLLPTFHRVVGSGTLGAVASERAAAS